MKPLAGASGTVMLGAIVILCVIAAGAILLATNDDAGTQRVVIIIGLIAPTVASLVAAIRADTAAARLDGGLDARIQDGVHRAMRARRAGEDPAVPIAAYVPPE